MSEPQPSSSAQGPFSPAAVAAMIVVGVIAAILFLGLSSIAPELRGGEDGGAHALSKSAVGFAGLARLLRATGTPVVASRGHVRDAVLLVLTPPAGTDPKEVQAFRHFVERLVILPKWQAIPDPEHRAWVRKAGLWNPAQVVRPVSYLGRVRVSRSSGVSAPVVAAPTGVGLVPPLAFGPVDQLQTIEGPDLTPILVDRNGGIVLAAEKDNGMAYVLSDPDLLNNQALASLASARSAVTLMDRLRSSAPVVFDVTLNGFSRSRNLLRTAAEPPFLPALICALFAAALIGLHAAVRFGPPRRPERAFGLGKLALADNSAAMIRLARRQPRMARRYAALTRRAAAHAVGAPRDLGPESLDRILDALDTGGADQARFSALVREAEAVKTEAELMRAARRLFAFRQEIMGGSR